MGLSNTTKVNDLKKKATLQPSTITRVEGMSVLLMSLTFLVYWYDLARTLYLFPVADSFRWSGGETWMLLAWKNLLSHGHAAVPIAYGSTLASPPGLLLGSEWLTAFFYGAPQLVWHVGTDPVVIGRTVSFILAFTIIGLIGWAAWRLRSPVSSAIISAVILATTPAFAYASHSARYDILTAALVLSFVFYFVVFLQDQQKVSSRSSFLIGMVVTALAITSGPQLEILLLPLTLLVWWHLGIFRQWRLLMFTLLGGGAAFLALAILSTAMNGGPLSVPAFPFDSPFGAVLGDRISGGGFSWSNSSRDWGRILYYLWVEAPLFFAMIGLVLLSEIILIARRQTHRLTAFITSCFILTLLVTLLFQTPHAYYLVHILPLATLAFIAHAGEWQHAGAFRSVVIAAALAMTLGLIFFWVPGAMRAGKTGKIISEANTTAVQAAMEQESRQWTHRPFILTQGPALHELLRDTTLQVMMELAMQYPSTGRTFDSILARYPINYVLDYGRLRDSPYSNILETATPVFTRTGHFLDRNVIYFHDTTSELDTLTLYALHGTP